jgi:hypothetical protein
VALLEVKNRNIVSTDFKDLMCPKQKWDYALTQPCKCWMITEFVDGAFMIDIKNHEPVSITKVDRIDKEERQDIDNRLHCFWSIKQAKRLW